jgi:large-conductance mechanosensitive channel
MARQVKKSEKPAELAPAPSVPSAEEKLLAEIRDLLKQKS